MKAKSAMYRHRKYDYIVVSGMIDFYDSAPEYERLTETVDVDYPDLTELEASIQAEQATQLRIDAAQKAVDDAQSILDAIVGES